MKKESLEKIRVKIIEILENEDIDIVDKVELMNNLCHFLDPNKYKENIKVLKIHFDKK